MRTFLFAALIFFFSDVDARDIDGTITGSWYNAAQSGHGFSVEILPDDRAVIYWYVYNPDGTPTFLVAIGTVSGNSIDADVYHHTGMKFGEFDNSNLVQTHWGTLTFTLHDCSHATLDYSSTMRHGGEDFGSGSIPLSRLSSVVDQKCTSSRLQGNFQLSLVRDGQVALGAAMLFGNGEMAFFGTSSVAGGVGIGTWRETGNDGFAFEITSFSFLGGWEDVAGSGTIRYDGFTATYLGNGQIIATKSASFQLGLTYGHLAGTYDIESAGRGIIGTITADQQGNISGSTYTGCALDGYFYIPDEQFSQAYADVTLSNCADASRIVGAAGYDYDEGSITIFGSDGDQGILWLLD